MNIEDICPTNRIEALRYYFNEPEATLDWLSSETGIAKQQILSGGSGPISLTGGFTAIRTCDAEWRVKTLAPRHRGDWPYWRDAVKGYWATGALNKAYDPATLAKFTADATNDQNLQPNEAQATQVPSANS